MSHDNGHAPPPDPLAALGLGSQFNPFAPGAYEWRRVAVMATLPGDPVPRPVNVYLCVWSDANGRRVINVVGDDAMRSFLRSAEQQLSGLLLPPGT